VSRGYVRVSRDLMKIYIVKAIKVGASLGLRREEVGQAEKGSKKRNGIYGNPWCFGMLSNNFYMLYICYMAAKSPSLAKKPRWPRSRSH
jgi:hypothetical protein